MTIYVSDHWKFLRIKIEFQSDFSKFVLNSYIFENSTSEIECENSFSSIIITEYLSDCYIRVTVLLEYFDLF